MPFTLKVISLNAWFLLLRISFAAPGIAIAAESFPVTIQVDAGKTKGELEQELHLYEEWEEAHWGTW